MTTPLQAQKIVDAYKTKVDLPLADVLNAPPSSTGRGEAMGVDSQQPLRYAQADASSVDQSNVDPILDPIHWDRVT